MTIVETWSQPQNGEFSRVVLDPLITIDHRLEIPAVSRHPYDVKSDKLRTDLIFERVRPSDVHFNSKRNCSIVENQNNDDSRNYE